MENSSSCWWTRIFFQPPRFSYSSTLIGMCSELYSAAIGTPYIGVINPPFLQTRVMVNYMSICIIMILHDLYYVLLWSCAVYISHFGSGSRPFWPTLSNGPLWPLGDLYDPMVNIYKWVTWPIFKWPPGLKVKSPFFLCLDPKSNGHLAYNKSWLL